MSARPRCPTLVCIATFTAIATPALAGDACVAEPLQPHGSEFRVNEATADGQGLSTVAVAPDGDFVVGWVRLAALPDLFLRRIGRDGTPRGPERDVLDSDSGRAMMIYSRPALLPLANGEVRAAWSGNYWEQTGPSMWTNRDGIVGGHYAGDGTSIVPEWPVNTVVSGQPAYAGIAALSSGGHGVTWSGAGGGDSNGTWMRFHSGDGTPLFDQRLANVTTTDGQFMPAVSSDRNGTVNIVWRGNGPGDTQGVFLRRFDSIGTPFGSETRINVTTAQTQLGPDIGTLADGRFAVAWMGNGPGDDWGVFARPYRANGTPLTGELAVNTTTGGNQVEPSIAMLPDGGFVVAWAGAGDGDEAGVFLRRFDEYGHAQAGETLVNTTTDGGQSLAGVAVSAGGEAIVSWNGNGTGDTLGVFARTFERPGRVFRGAFEADDAPCTP